jgi:hypothetical protein
MNSRSENARWDTPEELYADYEAGDSEAYQMLGYIRNWDEITAGMERTRKLAEGGEPSAMFQLYMQGRHLTGSEDVDRAIELLEQESTPTARWYLEALVRHSVDLRSREGMLLMAEMMEENYCSPQLSSDQCREGAKRNREGLAALRSAAADGDPDAKWVVEHLSENPAEVRINS